jgi:gamma-glutamyltranspeptidase/glutathione hydrolase
VPSDRCLAAVPPLRTRRLGLDLLAPATHYAEQGFLSQHAFTDWSQVAKLRADIGTAAISGTTTLRGGGCRQASCARRDPRTIAAQGPKGFYEGAVAQDMATSRRGSPSRWKILRAIEAKSAPITTNYRGLDILELPPNTQGLTALVLLNILEQFDLAALDPLGPDRFHLMLEGARLAYAVRDAHVAEPSAMRVPVAKLIDKAFAAKLAGQIDRTRRVPRLKTAGFGGDTVYLSVVDRDRMAVSFINTLYSIFGVGICTEKSGIMLINRGACFVLDPEHPNSFGPHKRPLHTIIPALALRGAMRLHRVMGAHYQPIGQSRWSPTLWITAWTCRPQSMRAFSVT